MMYAVLRRSRQDGTTQRSRSGQREVSGAVMMRATRIPAVALATALALAACGAPGGNPSANGTSTADPSATAGITLPTEDPLPTAGYTYAKPAGTDLCTQVVDFPGLSQHYDKVGKVDLPDSALECSLDLHSGDEQDLLDIKVQLDESNYEIEVWRGVDAAMGSLTAVEGLGQRAYYFDSDRGRTLVVRDANLVARILFLPAVNGAHRAVTDQEDVMLAAITKFLLHELRTPAP
jgi:hypothetical protein